MAAEPGAAPAVPLSVRWITAGREWLEGHRRQTLLGVLGAVLVGALASGFYTVATDETAAVLRFGRIIDTAVAPGLHWRLPWGIDIVTKVRTSEVVRDTVQGDWAPEVALVSADENLIEATLVVQYRISDLGAYLYGTEDPKRLVEQVVRAALIEAFATTQVDDVLTSAKAAVQNFVRESGQDQLDAYGAGLTLVSVSLQSVNPPAEAAEAFRAVSDARAESAQAVNRAEGERGRSSRLAGGEAAQLAAESRAAAEARQSQAKGAAERFESLLRQYREAPGQARVELYSEAMRKVLPRARLILLAPGEKPRIDVQLIERQTPTRPLPPGGQ